MFQRVPAPGTSFQSDDQAWPNLQSTHNGHEACTTNKSLLHLKKKRKKTSELHGMLSHTSTKLLKKEKTKRAEIYWSQNENGRETGKPSKSRRWEMPTLKMRRLREWCGVQGPNGLQLGSNSWCLGVSVGLHTWIGLRRRQITAGL